MKLSKALQGYWLVKRQEFSPNTVPFYKLAFRRLQEFLGTEDRVRPKTETRERAQALLDLTACVKRMEENQRVGKW